MAGRVWRLVDGQRTVDQIAGRVANEFRLPHDQVLGDVLRFANKLFERGLLSYVQPSGELVSAMLARSGSTADR